MNIRSSDWKCSCSKSSPLRISSSWRIRSLVRSTEWRSTSLMVRNCGLLSSMTQQLGEILISQSEKAYSASSVLSDDTPGASCTCISTFAAVKSSTWRALILPFSMAFRMESMMVSVVFENGISRMTSVFGSSFSILARTFSTPPR